MDILYLASFVLQSWAALKADAEESRAHAARLAMEAERARQAEEDAQRQASLLQEALESLRSGDNPHLALHQLQLLHRLPLESVLSLQAQLCSCLHAVEQVITQTHNIHVRRYIALLAELESHFLKQCVESILKVFVRTKAPPKKSDL